MSGPVRIILGVVLLVAVAGGSFYGGMIYGTSQASAAAAAQFGNGNFANRGQGGQNGGFTGQPGQRGQNGAFAAQPGTVFGAIESIDGNNLIVTDNSGKQVKVEVTDTTLIEKNASVSVADLTVGETVIVSGSPNADESITARSVQSAPIGRLGGGQFRNQNATPQP